MVRPYAPRSVLRHIPFALLREFFDRSGIPIGLDWGAVEDGDAEAVYHAWLDLPPQPREAAEQAFRAVHDLATPFGVQAVVNESGFQGVDLTPGLDAVDGHHAKALWTLIRHPRVFSTAHLILTADALPGRYWSARTGLPGTPADVSPAAVQDLRIAVANLYRCEQGRGHRCTLEPCPRPDGLYLFAYLDDYAGTYVGHDDRGHLRRRPHRPAFEVVFVHAPAAGTLDLFAHGDRRLKFTLTDLFCRHLLGIPAPEDQPSPPAYRLEGLLDPGFQFPTDPVDWVREVRVRRLRVGRRGSRRRVTLEPDPGGGPGEAAAMLADHFPADRFPRSELLVAQATVTIRYAPPDGGRDRNLTFDVTWPDGCTLKGRPDAERELGEKYLTRWGLFDGGRPASTPAPGRVA